MGSHSMPSQKASNTCLRAKVWQMSQKNLKKKKEVSTSDFPGLYIPYLHIYQAWPGCLTILSNRHSGSWASILLKMAPIRKYAHDLSRKFIFRLSYVFLSSVYFVRVAIVPCWMLLVAWRVGGFFTTSSASSYIPLTNFREGGGTSYPYIRIAALGAPTIFL